MSDFKFPKYAETLREENEAFEKKFASREKEIETTSALIVNSDLSKSSHGQLVQTETCKKWLADLRESRHNQFLGKDYMMRAPEFERDSEEVDAGSYMDDKEAGKILTVNDEKHEGVKHVDDEYNPNITEEALSHDEVSRRFVQACTIDNTVAKCIDWKFEDLLNEAVKELDEAFKDDPDYKVPEDVDELVEASLEKYEHMRLLGHDTGPKLAIPNLSAAKNIETGDKKS